MWSAKDLQLFPRCRCSLLALRGEMHMLKAEDGSYYQSPVFGVEPVFVVETIANFAAILREEQ